MIKQFVKILVAFLAAGMIFSTGSAFAFGQCGHETHSPTSWVNQIGAMGVTQQTEAVEMSAGFHRMDVSLRSWVHKRVIAAPLAKAADPEDFGCHPGDLFSVGHRWLPKGTWVFVALPKEYTPKEIHLHSCSGCKAVHLHVSFVGKTECVNPEIGTAEIVIYVKKPKKPKPPSSPAPASVSCPNGTYLAATVSGSVCVIQSQTSTQTCGNGQVLSTTGCVTLQIQQSGCGDVVVINGHAEVNTNCGTVIETPCSSCEKHEEPHEPPPPACKLTNLRKLEAKDNGEAAYPGEHQPITVELICSSAVRVLLTFHAEFGRFEESTEEVTGTGKYKETLVVPSSPGLESDTYWVSAVELTTGHEFETPEHWKYAIQPESFH